MFNPTVWIAITLAVVVGFVLLKVLRGKPGKPLPLQADSPLMQTAEPSLSVVEQCCLQTLQQVAGGEYNIRTKVPIHELATRPAAPSSQRLDFVLFNNKNHQPACAVQLRSATGSDESQMEQLLNKARIPLYRLPRKSSYSVSSIRDLLNAHLQAPTPSPEEMIATISMKAFRLCKKCDSQMELKRASAGPHKGMLFWVCKDHPTCSGVELYTE